jgi:hypothetical protein
MPQVEPQVENDQQARWNEWLAKGPIRDLAIRRRFQYVTYFVALGLVAWLWWVL